MAMWESLTEGFELGKETTDFSDARMAVLPVEGRVTQSGPRAPLIRPRDGAG